MRLHLEASPLLLLLLIDTAQSAGSRPGVAKECGRLLPARRGSRGNSHTRD